MTRHTLLGSLLVATALCACGDDAGETTAATTTSGSGSGGESGTGGAASTSSSSTATTSSVGGGSSSSSSSGGTGTTSSTGGGGQGGSGGAGTGGAGTGGAGTGGAAACGTPSECAATWEDNAANRFDDLVTGDPDQLAAFLTAVPKGGDLHNHLTGAVYAETYLDWALADGDCIDPNTHQVKYSNNCGANDQDVPTSGAFYDAIVRAWSMKDFVAGAETGHDHFFATFGKFGAVAGAHRNENLADVATRAASENAVYVETMFNLGKNLGDLSADNWSGTLNASDLPALYDAIITDPAFETELQNDINVVTQARTQYRNALGCSGGNQPAACDVEVRFTAQVSRTGPKDTVFGQLVSAFEMASQTPWIVAANLSSPEDDSTSINNYGLHMAMLDFLYDKYTATGLSPLHITLHAGELTSDYAPPAALLFHIKDAVQVGHAERIGHGIDILSETGNAALLTEMAERGVLVETCLSSNIQILEVSGSDHPLATYMANGVPVALATDDQGVSRSSLAGEYLRGALDQALSYRQLKTMARDSLEHAFLPGESLWVAVADAEAVAACAPTDTMGLGSTPNASCEAFLQDSERATAQWELERRFREFESQQ